MKKLVIILFAVAMIAKTYAQSDTTKYVYLQVQSIGKLSGKSKFEIDFGYAPYYIDERTKGELTAGVSTFESHIDVLSFLSAKGWQYVENFTLNVSGYSQLYFIHRKPKRELAKK